MRDQQATPGGTIAISVVLRVLCVKKKSVRISGRVGSLPSSGDGGCFLNTERTEITETESIAVGSEKFVREVAQRIQGRQELEIQRQSEHWHLREVPIPYRVIQLPDK